MTRYHRCLPKTKTLALLLFAVIEQGLEWGARRILFGGTALEPKARLGCTPVPCQVWVRHRVPLVNTFVRQVPQALPHEEAPDRNPFKPR